MTTSSWIPRFIVLLENKIKNISEKFLLWHQSSRRSQVTHAVPSGSSDAVPHGALSIAVHRPHGKGQSAPATANPQRARAYYQRLPHPHTHSFSHTQASRDICIFQHRWSIALYILHTLHFGTRIALQQRHLMELLVASTTTRPHLQKLCWHRFRWFLSKVVIAVILKHPWRLGWGAKYL